MDIEFDLPSVECAAASSLFGGALKAMHLLAVQNDGTLTVTNGGNTSITCLWLEGRETLAPPLAAGDRVLVSFLGSSLPPVVLGRIGRYTSRQPGSKVVIEATESLTLQCGESSMTLRADGKVMVKGEDVLIRAKGTQRIRAGNVAIN